MSALRPTHTRLSGWLLAVAILLGAGGNLVCAQPATTDPRYLQPPEEAKFLNHPVPDVRLLCQGRPELRLSEVWTKKPVLLTLVFTRCAGVCSPFLRSLKTAVAEVGGAGADYQVVVGSFDPRDHAADMAGTAHHLGLETDPGWTFAALSSDDAQRLAAAVGFWYRWDEGAQQFDHPAMLIAIDRGRVVRLLVGGAVSRVRLEEVVDQLNGKFVAAYPLPGKVAFRCFEYGRGGRLKISWGILILTLPGIVAGCLAWWIFRRPPSRRLHPDGQPAAQLIPAEENHLAG